MLTGYAIYYCYDFFFRILAKQTWLVCLIWLSSAIFAGRKQETW